MFYFKIKDNRKYCDFYEGFQFKNPQTILVLMVLTGGLYAIHWLYSLNKEMERSLKDEVPYSIVGICVTLIFPFAWIVFFFMYNLIFHQAGLFYSFFEKLGWIFLIFLILEYLYKFCDVFGNLTDSSGDVWFYSFFPGFLALSLIALDIFYGYAFFFFVFINIPAMQSQLNTRSDEYMLAKVRKRFNSMTLEDEVKS